jgi:hypothetical protein
MTTRVSNHNPGAGKSGETALPPRPPFWWRVSVLQGNVMQLAGLAIGVGLLFAAAHVQAPAVLLVLLMLLGWFAIYVCCHAIAHYVVGRLMGIQFVGYGLRGSDHPQDYPPAARPFISRLPTFTALTDKTSMRQARPIAKALMFGAGETSTAVCSILTGWYAWHSGIPGGLVWLVAMVIFNLFATVVTATAPRGDYAKARRALRRQD